MEEPTAKARATNARAGTSQTPKNGKRAAAKPNKAAKQTAKQGKTAGRSKATKPEAAVKATSPTRAATESPRRNAAQSAATKRPKAPAAAPSATPKAPSPPALAPSPPAPAPGPPAPAPSTPPTAPSAPAAVPSAPEPSPSATPAPRRPPLWARIVADPGYTPEHLARAAVHQFGPRALEWATQMRERYPYASPDGIARLAGAHFGKQAQRQAAAAAMVPAGSLVAGTALARAQAQLVLAIAAAYGIDPTAAPRARELLALMRVPRLTEPVPAALRNAARTAVAVLARRLANRALPFGAAAVALAQGSSGSADLAARAMHLYRGLAVKG